MKGRLFRKYVLLIMALVSGALVISAGIELYAAYQENTAALGRIQREKALAAAARIELFVNGIVQQIAWTNEAQWGSRAVPPSERRFEYLRLLRQAPAITDLSLLDASGREEVHVSRLALDELGSGRDFSGDAKFTQAKAAGTYFGPVYFRKDTEPYMTIAVAGSGRRAGVTVAEVNLKFVWDVVSQIRVGIAGLAYAVDARGRLIAHPDISLVLRQLDAGATEAVRARAAGSDAEPATVAANLQGHRVLTAYAEIPPLGWVVFVEQPLAEAFTPLYAALWRTIGLLLLGLLIAMATGVAFARRLVRPILQIREGAARIGAGELHHRIEVKSGDELEAMASEFNRMAERLEDSYAGLEQKVEERTRQLDQANRHKSQFLSAMSHELRTPLNAIIGFSEALQARFFGELNAKQAEYVDDIHASGQHLLSLINDILDLSKIEAGRMELDVSRFDVAASVEQALTLVRERAARSDLRLDVEVAPDVGSYAGDERKFRQILLNLLSNAIKFTPRGGQVRVSASRANGALQVAVSDTGIGIAPGDQAHLFEAFQRVGDRRQEGTGLGLTLARKFVELHGGRLDVASAANRGSTFTVSLPLTS